MKTTAIALLTVFLLSFSLGHAQEQMKVKKPLQKTQIKRQTTETATLNTNLSPLERALVKPPINKKSLGAIRNSLMRSFIEKKEASRFQATEDYPSAFDEPRNGNESKLVLKNEDGVYSILYRTSNQKEIAYYVYNNVTKSEYELFKFLMDIDDYETVTDPDEKLVILFKEVGIKRLDNATYVGLEENSVGILKATYEGDIYVYTNRESWMRDGSFISYFSGN